MQQACCALCMRTVPIASASWRVVATQGGVQQACGVYAYALRLVCVRAPFQLPTSSSEKFCLPARWTKGSTASVKTRCGSSNWAGGGAGGGLLGPLDRRSHICSSCEHRGALSLAGKGAAFADAFDS